jgi:putative endonuclease
MPASVYILFSPKRNRFYVGATTRAVQERLDKHRTSFYGHHYTSRSDDWEVESEMACADYAQAGKAEKYIKGRKSRPYLLRLISDLAARNDIMNRIR